MAASTIVPLTEHSQELFINYYNKLQESQSTSREELRAKFEEADKQYQREVDSTEEQRKAKAANNAGNQDKLQNVVVPVVAPQVETAVVYQTSVFLTGYPLFGVVASPRYIDAALQLETKIEDESHIGGWRRELILTFRDGYKYNLAPVEVTWCSDVTTYVPSTDPAVSVTEAAVKKVLWSGNKLRRLDPYNTFWDTRVAPTEVHKYGEFIGYTELMSKIRLKAFVASLQDKLTTNLRPAFESSLEAGLATNAGAHNFYIPSINPGVTIKPSAEDVDWMQWVGMDDKNSKDKIKYRGAYEVTTLYCRILPSEFALTVPARNTPQIYKLVIVNHKHIIYAELQTNAHNYLPIIIAQPLEDGLAYQTKSLANNATTFQQLTTSYMNSIIASRRRAIADRALYDPSRITSAAINSPNPSAKIPVRPAAYGQDLSKSVYAFPYREDQAANSMQQIGFLISLANNLAGQNPARQGQFVKGNKTLSEFDDVMQNANGRDQLVSILLEDQLFTPMKEIIKTNILQYQGGTTLYNRDKKRMVEIDPVKLREAVMAFKVSDGSLPSSKILNTDNFAVALQVIGSSPQIGSGYNIAQLFSYLMKTQGADVSDFEKSPEQVAYEQAMMNWQNVAALAIEKGQPVPPQPVPANYGYNPGNADNQAEQEDGAHKAAEE